MCRLEVVCTLEMNLSICPVPHSRGSWNTVSSPRSSWYLQGAQFDQLKMIWKICEFSFIIVQQVSLPLFIGPRWFVRCRQFCGNHQGLFLSNRFSCTFWTTRDSPGQFVAHVRYCSVHTELIDGDDRAKNQFSGVVVATEVYGQFSFSFASQRSSFKSTESTEYGMSNSSQCRELDRIDGEPMEIELKEISQDSLHCRFSPRSRTWWLKLSVNLSNCKDESSSCQCTTTMCGKKKETKNCVLRIPKP